MKKRQINNHATKLVTLHGEFNVCATDNELEVFLGKDFVGTLPNNFEDFDNLDEEEMTILVVEVMKLYEETL